jgi:PQQ-dependent dehydrogenase (methanol/ethanol family)
MIAGDYGAWRYSPLRQIDSTNVARLRVRTRSPFDRETVGERLLGWADSQRVWYRPRTWQLQTRRWLGASERQTSTPVVLDGVAYFTGSYSRVLAVDLATGSSLWVYKQPMPRVPLVCCGPHNRGVAVAGDRVYAGTLDAHLIALDRRSGKLDWDVAVADPAAGYSITAAPLAVRGLVLIGVSGADYGVRGFLDAYDAATGALRWRFWTVPAPAQGGWWGPWTRVTPDGDTLPRNIAQERRDSARYPDSWRHGGGSVWMTPAYDSATGLVYIGTGNPAPALDDALRPGDNLYTSSIVALDLATGALRWHYQISPHDLWDRDASNPIVLFSAHVGDSLVPALAQANRTGRVYVLDRRTGRRLLRSDPFVPEKNVFHRPTVDGTVSYPSVGGGNVSAPPAYVPSLDLLVVPGVHRPSLLRLDRGAREPGRSYYGGQDGSLGGGWGNLSAVELGTGRVRWQHRTDTPPISTGVLATAGGLVFYGDGTNLVAAEIDSGRILHRLDVGCQIDGTPVTFLENGNQELAVVCRAGMLTLELAQQER